jgi:hypothetical protein
MRRKPQREFAAQKTVEMNAEIFFAISTFEDGAGAGQSRSSWLATNAATDMMARTNQRIITWLHGEATEPTDEGERGMMLLAAHPSIRRKKESERERERERERSYERKKVRG